jgi:hypothetical protein
MLLPCSNTSFLSGTPSEDQPMLPIDTRTLSDMRAPAVSCEITVKNTGPRAGDEVVIVFTGPNATSSSEAKASLDLPDPDPLAIKQVVDFARVSLESGASSTLTFDLPLRSFAQVDATGRLVLYAGLHVVRVGRGVGNSDDVVIPFNVGEHTVLRDAFDLAM